MYPQNGNSKGYAFVEFWNADVAKIVAETMHKYLMFNKLLVCQVVPENRLHRNMFKMNKFAGREAKLAARDVDLARSKELVLKSNKATLEGCGRIAQKLKAVGVKLDLKSVVDAKEKSSPATEMVHSVYKQKLKIAKEELAKEKAEAKRVRKMLKKRTLRKRELLEKRPEEDSSNSDEDDDDEEEDSPPVEK